MKKICTIGLLLTWYAGIFLMINSLAAAHDKVIVLPLCGALGDAMPGDVIQGKTFSCNEGKRLSGTLVLKPESTGDAEDSDVIEGGTFSNSISTGRSGPTTDKIFSPKLTLTSPCTTGNPV